MAENRKTFKAKEGEAGKVKKVKKMDWLTLALAGMVLFSISNLFVKLFVSNPAFDKIDYSLYAAPAILVVIGITITLFFSYQNLSPNLFSFLLGFLFFAALGFVAFVSAVKTGKVALVTAILSLSTVLTAILSFYFLGDQFSAKEILAIAFATMSVLILVI